VREYKILVAGSRSVKSEEWVHRMLDKLLINVVNATPTPQIVVIQGTARGPDRFARSWAIKNGHRYEDHPADWDNLGRRAGYARNEQMVKQRPDAAVFFWDGESNGTLHAINLVKETGIPHRVLYPQTHKDQ